MVCAYGGLWLIKAYINPCHKQNLFYKLAYFKSLISYKPVKAHAKHKQNSSVCFS